jgi:hypothetical protein
MPSISHPLIYLSAAAAGEKEYGDDYEPDDVVVVENVAKAVIHKEFLQNYLRAFCLSVSIICQVK